MTIILKNKATLLFDEFIFRCTIGKKGLVKNKVEGDKKTPVGTYSLGNLFILIASLLSILSAYEYVRLTKNFMKEKDRI